MAWTAASISLTVILSVFLLASLTSVGLLGWRVANTPPHHHEEHHGHHHGGPAPPSSHGGEEHGHGHGNDDAFAFIVGALVIFIFVAALVMCFVWCVIELAGKA
jgi:hypothetical protein